MTRNSTVASGQHRSDATRHEISCSFGAGVELQAAVDPPHELSEVRLTGARIARRAAIDLLRAAEIDSSSVLPPDVLREQLKSTAAELEAALAALDSATWQTEVKSALGRTIPAAEIPWMRVREVWLHAVDL